MGKKIRTLTQFQDALDLGLAWRKKEILYLRMSIKNTPALAAKTIVRAGVTLLYAHWEGFIKEASLAYLDYVNNQGIKYSQLQSCFVVFGMKGKLNSFQESRKARVNRQIVDFLMGEMDKEARLVLSSAIDTESNLSSGVFDNIAYSLDVNTSQYQTKYNLIDESLLRRRNNIAHGEYLDLMPNDWYQLAEDILGMLDWYKTDLMNSAALKKYIRT